MANRDRKKPNILLFFTDQQRADTIGALGNPAIRTPSLDLLCREGTAFTNAFSPCPVCVPARCSMKYGQYPHTSGCYENNYPMPTDGTPSLMDTLTAHGYRTHGIGKCHFTPDAHALRGFETRERQEEMAGTPDDDEYYKYLVDRGYTHLAGPNGQRGEMYYIPQVGQLPPEDHMTQWVGDRSLQFLETQSDSSQPWFLFCSFIHPHPPFAPPVPWHRLYRAPLLPPPHVPPDAESLQVYINRRQNRYKYRDQGIDRNLLRCMRAYYYACISFIDYQVGRILDALEQSGQMENTLLLFTSDHGEHLGDYNCFGKRGMLDVSARVPLVVCGHERLTPNRVCPRPASLVDILPTLLNAAGAGTDAHETDGVDLADLATGGAERPAVFAQYERGATGLYMAVTERWKYVYSAADDYELLFDRREDPRETRNRAGIPFLRDVQEEMKARLVGHLREGGEEAALDGADWKRYPPTNVPPNPDAGLLVQDIDWCDPEILGYTD